VSVAACTGTATPGPAPEVDAPTEIRTGSFVSQFRKQASTAWTLALPRSTDGGSTDGTSLDNGSADNLPVAVFLHGVGADHRMVFDELQAEHILAQHVARGGTPFAIAAVDGGDTWWHRRASGIDAQAMVLREFLPLLASLGLDTGKVAVFGLSMGGFGALLLAAQHLVPGLRAVAAMSPAIWSMYDAGRSDNFDNATDFAAHDIFALRPELESLPKRIDCGTGDTLLYSVQDYVKDLPGEHEGGFQDGGHDSAYWRSVLPDVLSFLGGHLA
jgi:pimeloyl-ACP methyl ester carboxylesterase